MRRVGDRGRYRGRWASRVKPVERLSKRDSCADAVDDEFPFDFEAAADFTGRVLLRSVSAQTIRRIWDLPRMLRFGIASWRATVSLARYLDRFVEELAREERERKEAEATKTPEEKQADAKAEADQQNQRKAPTLYRPGEKKQDDKKKDQNQ